MARPEKTLDVRSGPVTWFASDLRELRKGSGGLTYRAMAARTHYSATVLSEAAASRKLPTLAVTKAYVVACGGDVQQWTRRWEALNAQAAPRSPNPKPDAPAEPVNPDGPAELVEPVGAGGSKRTRTLVIGGFVLLVVALLAVTSVLVRRQVPGL